MRKRSLLTILIPCICFMGSSVGAEPDPCVPMVYKTIPDEEGKPPVELKLHVFLPESHQASDNRPAIVFFFGGGWHSGEPNQFFPHCKELAAQGMVAMSAEYRVASRHGTSPKEAVADAKSAIRWIRENAASLGINPERIAAGGGSAGGHLAAATATLDHFDEATENSSVSSRPNALVLFNPVLDNGPGGYGHERVKDYWEAFSPLHNISVSTPPAIVFLGTNDHHIPVATMEHFKNKMEASGVRCDLHLYKGQPHGFFNLKKSPEHYKKTVHEMKRFLSSLWGSAD